MTTSDTVRTKPFAVKGMDLLASELNRIGSPITYTVKALFRNDANDEEFDDFELHIPVSHEKWFNEHANIKLRVKATGAERTAIYSRDPYIELDPYQAFYYVLLRYLIHIRNTSQNEVNWIDVTFKPQQALWYINDKG